jgi:hypothetical protein
MKIVAGLARCHDQAYAASTLQVGRQPPRSRRQGRLPTMSAGHCVCAGSGASIPCTPQRFQPFSQRRRLLGRRRGDRSPGASSRLVDLTFQVEVACDEPNQLGWLPLQWKVVGRDNDPGRYPGLSLLARADLDVRQSKSRCSRLGEVCGSTRDVGPRHTRKT